MQRSVGVAITGAGQERARGGLRRGLFGAALIGLFVGCAGGDDKDTSGFSGFIPNPSSATNQTGQSGGTEDASSGESGESGESTSPVDPTTGPMTTGPMTTGPMTTGPMTTDDPMTTGPMTTDSTTTTTTGDGTTTTTGPDETTGEPPPPPPPKDPQPADGIYSDCFAKECDFTMVDVCLELTDAMMKKIDGFCSLVCNGDADCQPKPNVPAVSKCVDTGGDKFCLLQCNGVADCPTGMSCQSVNINGNTAKYCW
jgi:hypothetical protein